MKNLTCLLFFIALTACDSSRKDPLFYDVEYAGALKRMMRQGDLSANADLQDFADTAHLFGLGAIENLKGEIQVFDGMVWNTSVSDDSLVVDSTFSNPILLRVVWHLRATNH